MLNEILSFFGLITIRRAKILTLRLHTHYVKCVVHGVAHDFGASGDFLFEDKAATWWVESFDSVLDQATDDVLIANEPIFTGIK